MRRGSAVRTARAGWFALLVTVVARGVVGLLVTLVLWSVIPAALGWQSTVVMTGSMAPAVFPGDVAVSRPAEESRLRLGHVLLTDDPDRPGRFRLHRLVDVREGGLVLQGDANADADSSTVPVGAVHGIAVLRVPAVGLPFLWAHEDATLEYVIAGGTLLVLLGAAFTYRPHDDRSAAPRPAGDRWTGTPRRRRAWLVGLLCALLVVVPTGDSALAAYGATTSNPASAFAAAYYYRCAEAGARSSATRYYAMQESAGTTAANTGLDGAAADGTYEAGPTLGTPGPNCGPGDARAVTLDGATQFLNTGLAVTPPTVFTVQIWFRTGTAGGRLIGLGTGTGTVLTTPSSQADRVIYMGDDGRLSFGVFNGTAHVAVTSSARYDDDAWHLATATLSLEGMTLYVDGTAVASGTDATALNAQTSYAGTWRIGWDNLDDWPNRPANRYFTGSLAHASVYSGSALSPTEVQRHHVAGR